MLEYIKAVVEALTAIAAVTGAFVAASGLRTWKAQLRGKTEYELARRVLRGVFEVRDLIAAARSPFVSSAEVESAFEEAGLTPERDDPRQHEVIYERRLKPVTKALSDLRVDALEAEVIWGQPVRDAQKALHKCYGELYSAIVMYIRGRKDDRYTTHLEANLEKYESVIYQTSEDPLQDVFTGRVAAAVDVFEALLRPHLTLGLGRKPNPLFRLRGEAGST